MKKTRKTEDEVEKLKEKLHEKKGKIRKYNDHWRNDNELTPWSIGIYLHEDLAQKLVSAKVTTSVVKNELSEGDLTKTCETIIYTLDESISEVQDLFQEILLMNIETEGLEQAFNHLKLLTGMEYGVNCRLETDQTINEITDRTIAANLYNISEEAIINAINPGEAKNIKIALVRHDQQLFLQIKDDGKRINTSDEKSRDVTIMKDHTEKMGGQFSIKDEEDENSYTTCVCCSYPMEIFGAIS